MGEFDDPLEVPNWGWACEAAAHRVRRDVVWEHVEGKEEWELDTDIIIERLSGSEQTDPAGEQSVARVVVETLEGEDRVQNALMLGATCGLVDVVQKAVREGADVNVGVEVWGPGGGTRTPIMAAVVRGHVDVLRVLLAVVGADPWVQRTDYGGRTAGHALHWAWTPEVMAVLLIMNTIL